MNKLLSFLVLMLLITACRKEAISNLAPVDPYLYTIDTSANTFQPYKQGCYWIYLSKTASGTTVDTVTIKSTGRDTLIEGSFYKIFSKTTKDGTGYQFQLYQAPNYRQRIDTLKFNNAPGLGNTFISGVDVFYYNETATAGSRMLDYYINHTGNTHTFPITVLGNKQDVDTKSYTTLDSTKNSFIINKDTFNNVVFTSVDLQYFDNISLGSAIWKTGALMKFTISKKVGIIKLETYNSAGALSNLLELYKYNIVK